MERPAREVKKEDAHHQAGKQADDGANQGWRQRFRIGSYEGGGDGKKKWGDRADGRNPQRGGCDGGDATVGGTRFPAAALAADPAQRYCRSEAQSKGGDEGGHDVVS